MPVVSLSPQNIVQAHGLSVARQRSGVAIATRRVLVAVKQRHHEVSRVIAGGDV